ncbi:MAG: uroporphyrinogen decarboxylase [Candidatus Hydrogenedentota bacterium]
MVKKSPDRKTITARERFLCACRCERTDRAPVWLMRQAGRSLPEYRRLRKKYSFLELVRDPDLAAEVTLQPVRRFGFDAAILFSDILVVPEALGQSYRFVEGKGISLSFSIRRSRDIDRLRTKGIAERLAYEYDALRLLRTAIPETALLGFGGSPWTLGNYMAEGGSSGEFAHLKEWFFEDRKSFDRLMAILTRALIEYFKLQIRAGVDAIQIFDSFGGMLAQQDYWDASGRWIERIIRALDGKIPVIVFARGVHGIWNDLAATGADALSIDWSYSLSEAASCIPSGMALQGNLDPALLRTTPETVARSTRRIIDEMKGRPGHIFNLGHGVPPDAKLENIEALVETVRSHRARPGGKS